jgi:TonB-dependent SusC/RagA subfamily outer membrane receptor
MKFKVTIQRKLLRLMRFSIIQLCLMAWAATLALANNTYAQDILSRPLSITVENERVQNILKAIEKETEVSFSYRKGLFKKDSRITISAQKERLAEVLNRLCALAGGIQYEVVGQQIILTPSEKTGEVSPILVSGTKKGQLAVEIKPAVPPITVSGTVKDETGEPLPGATVAVKGTTTGTTTDVNGRFTITAPNGNAILLFQYTGYRNTELPIEKRTEFLIQMEPIDQALTELVVVGYGAVNRRDILGAVGSVKERAIEQTAPSNTLDAMQGRVSGVQIVSNGGPGAGSDIRIRGTSTFSGGVNPLYVVDGQQLEDINNINPNDIASIEILKDGASAAMYGSKSANGVVIITTKAGKAGEAKFSVDFNQAYNFLASSIPTANTRQRFFYENVRAGGNPLAVPTDSLSVLYQISNDLQELITRVSNRSQVNLERVRDFKKSAGSYLCSDQTQGYDKTIQ